MARTRGAVYTRARALAAETRYHAAIRSLSDRLVAVQQPIRILDAVKWDAETEERFLANDARELPLVDAASYARNPLPFDPAEKRRELQELERDILRSLGQFNPVGGMLRRSCVEYQTVVRMLEARGTPEFSRLSQELYGSASDVFHAGDPTVADLGEMLSETLASLEGSAFVGDDVKVVRAEDAVSRLQARFDRLFVGENGEGRVQVMLSDGIVADAAAGSNYLKIRSDATFSEREIRALEVHEGWVHLGTTWNGLQQPVCTFLSKGPPSAVATQEGLAVLMEFLAFVSHPYRVRRLTNRIRGIAMADAGADFRDVFSFYREQGYSDREAYANALRVFRGSTPNGGPFTKDLLYAKGFVLVYNFFLLAVRKGRLDRIHMLFCGKTALEDVRSLGELVDEGTVVPPRFIPPPLVDLGALAAWFCFSGFLNRLSFDRVESDYARLL